MLVPRRVRRRLLLPPGWVALGFLLLLGCQALQPWAGQLRRWNVMQLTMFPLKADTSASYLSFSKAYLAHKKVNDFDPYVTPLQTVAASTLQKMRPWHNVEFSGKHLADFLNAATTESAVRRIIADTSHAGGVRIRFLPGATYANLVKVLDIMNYTNQKKYFLDIHHRPTTLYAITTLPTPKYPVFVCSSGNYLYHVLPKPPGLWQRAADFYEGLVMQAGRAWVPTALLLVVIGLLSMKHSFRANLSSRNLKS